MCVRAFSWGSLLAVLLYGSVVSAQSEAGGAGAIEGTVVDKDTGEPVPEVAVIVDETDVVVSTGDDGTYRVPNVAPGTYTVRAVAYANALAARTITVRSGAPTSAPLKVSGESMAGEVVVITGSRSEERVIDAPASVESVTRSDMDRSGGPSYVASLRDSKGIDYTSSGLSEQRISARGFSSHFNNRMLFMVDGRLATLPGLGQPQGNALPVSPLDMKAVEVAIGPASALYGPNAHTGVVNVRTLSPWDKSGAEVRLRGGSQSMIDGVARVAGTVDDKIGWKVNAHFMQGEDFRPDRNEAQHFFGTSFFEEDLVENYDVSTAQVGGTAYYRFAEDSFVKANYNFSDTTGFSLNNLGRARLEGWQVHSQTLQLSTPKWYAHVTRTANDAGDTFRIDAVAQGAQGTLDMGGTVGDAEIAAFTEAATLTDKAQLYDAGVQYRHSAFGVDAITGVQARYQLPDSNGTILDDGGDKSIDFSEIGAYLQLDYKLWDDRIRLIGAGRVDAHSDYDTQFSPKATAVFAPDESHRIRLGYNRAFKAPTPTESYLSLAATPFAKGNRDGYDIRNAAGDVLAVIDPLSPEQVNSVEIGYKASLARSVFVDVVAYNSWYDNFISPLSPVSNPGDMANPTFAFDSEGNPIAEGTPVQGLLLTYLNFGEAEVRGADLGVNYYWRDKVTVSGGVSVIELVDFSAEGAAQQDLLLNVPTVKIKGSVAINGLGFDNYFARASVRYHQAYRFRSGYWNSGTFLGDGVDDGGEDGDFPGRTVVDVSGGYLFPEQRVAVRAYLLNLTDSSVPDVLGAPVPARWGYLELSYTFDDVNY